MYTSLRLLDEIRCIVALPSVIDALTAPPCTAKDAVAPGKVPAPASKALWQQIQIHQAVTRVQECEGGDGTGRIVIAVTKAIAAMGRCPGTAVGQGYSDKF